MSGLHTAGSECRIALPSMASSYDWAAVVKLNLSYHNGYIHIYMYIYIYIYMYEPKSKLLKGSIFWII